MASAQSAKVHVQWNAPADCGDQSTLETRIERRLSAPRADAVTNVAVHVTRRGASYAVDVRLWGAVRGRRHLEAESCDAAIDAVALLVAIAIDPRHAIATETAAQGDVASGRTGTIDTTDAARAPTDGSAAEPRQSDAADATQASPQQDANETTEPASASTSEQTAAAESAVEPDDTSPSTLHFALGAGAVVDSGTTPGVTIGATLPAQLWIARVVLQLRGTWLLPRETAVASDAALSAGWIGAALDACYLFGGGVRVGPCVGAELGQLSSSARGLLDRRDARELAAFATAGILSRVRLTSAFYGALWIGMRTPVSYPRLLVTGIGEAFRPASLGVGGALMLTWVLG